MDAMEAHSEEDGDGGMGGVGRWTSWLGIGSDESIPSERLDSWMPKIERRMS